MADGKNQLASKTLMHTKELYLAIVPYFASLLWQVLLGLFLYLSHNFAPEHQIIVEIVGQHNWD